VCRYETEGPVPDGSRTKAKVQEDIRSLVLHECKQQFTLLRCMKKAEADPNNGSGALHGLFCSAHSSTVEHIKSASCIRHRWSKG
jgi:hypothetical protein